MVTEKRAKEPIMVNRCSTGAEIMRYYHGVSVGKAAFSNDENYLATAPDILSSKDGVDSALLVTNLKSKQNIKFISEIPPESIRYNLAQTTNILFLPTMIIRLKYTIQIIGSGARYWYKMPGFVMYKSVKTINTSFLTADRIFIVGYWIPHC